MEFTTEQQPIEDTQSGEIMKNTKEIKVSDGSFKVKRGRLEMRDSDGNIVILLDANG